MVTRTIHTEQYDVDLGRLLARRLEQCGADCVLEQTGNAATICVPDETALPALSEALALLLCRDLQYFELARMTDVLPYSLQQKQEILTDALESARGSEKLEPVRAQLLQYLLAEECINVEGYLRFRMQGQLADWQLCVERAAADQMLCREYKELMALLRALSPQEESAGELSICLHPDGSCTLTDESDACIEYVDCSEEGILSLLVGMAPSRLTVYDLSGGSSGLAETIARVFSGRVRIYR